MPEGYKTVVEIETTGALPRIKLENDLIFYGLERGTREDTVNGILHDIALRHLAQRSHVQHTHYTYKQGDVVVEIGAFLGYYAMWIALQVGTTGRVIAIEAIPEYCEVLKANLEIFPQAKVSEVAAGSYTGKGTMYVGKRQTCGMRADVVSQYNETISEIEVEVDTADNLLSSCDSIDMAIIQVNGTELDVLEGMTETLSRVKNITIASQYNEEGVNHLEVVSDILRDSGFEVCDDGVVVYGGRL